MQSKRSLKRIGLVTLLTLLLLLLAPTAQAFEGRTGDEVVIGAGEVIQDDLYVAGNMVRMEGTVKGDLIAVGTSVIVSGTVEGDLLAAGQAVTVSGSVLGDVRAAGMALSLGAGASVAEDLAAVGLSLENQAGSSVGGDLLFAGSQALLAGSVAGDATVGAESMQLLGTIGGDLKADVGAEGEGPAFPPGFNPLMMVPNAPALPSIPSGLNLGSAAEVAGDLIYTAPAEVAVPPAVVAGLTNFSERIAEATAPPPPPTALDRFLGYVRTYVALLVVGLLMVWLVPKAVQRAEAIVGERPLASLGWGVVTVAAVVAALVLLAVVMIAVAAFLGLITLGNLSGLVVSVGLLLLFALAVAFGLSIAYASKITVCCLGGRWVLSRINADWGEGVIWPLAVGLLIFVILTAIPYLGGLVNLAVVLLGLGGLWLLGREYLSRPAAPAPAAAD